MLSMYTREIEILHEIAIAPIPPHAEKSDYLRDWSLAVANPAVNTPRPSRGTRIESCDFLVLIGDP